jgi:hypothetical protein
VFDPSRAALMDYELIETEIDPGAKLISPAVMRLPVATKSLGGGRKLATIQHS